MCLLRIGINVIYICSRCVFQVIVRFDEINNNWIDAKYCQMTLQSARWHCSHAFIGNPWSNESDANVEDSDCTVQMLLFFSITTAMFTSQYYLKLKGKHWISWFPPPHCLSVGPASKKAHSVIKFFPWSCVILPMSSYCKTLRN